MIRSSVAAFYAWLVCLFYSVAGFSRWDRFLMLRLLLRVRSEIEKIVHWMAEILFATEVAFRGLDRCMTEQELNLLQLTATVVAQLRAGSAEVMRCNVF